MWINHESGGGWVCDASRGDQAGTYKVYACACRRNVRYEIGTKEIGAVLREKREDGADEERVEAEGERRWGERLSWWVF